MRTRRWRITAGKDLAVEMEDGEGRRYCAIFHAVCRDRRPRAESLSRHPWGIPSIDMEPQFVPELAQRARTWAESWLLRQGLHVVQHAEGKPCDWQTWHDGARESA